MNNNEHSPHVPSPESSDDTSIADALLEAASAREQIKLHATSDADEQIMYEMGLSDPQQSSQNMQADEFAISMA